jgi:hypothetical protein
MAISDVIGIVERAMEEWLQIVFIPSRCHRRHDLVEIQILEELRGTSACSVGTSDPVRPHRMLWKLIVSGR